MAQDMVTQIDRKVNLRLTGNFKQQVAQAAEGRCHLLQRANAPLRCFLRLLALKTPG